MTDKREARPRRQPEAGQTGKINFGEANFPVSNFNTNSEKTQTAIYDLLPQGESNAIPSRQLAELVGAASVRDMQSRIADEREQGVLILSTCRNGGGYFRPSDGAEGRAEIERYIRTLRSRALSTLKILRTAKTALSDLDGQLTLDGGGGDG